MRAVRLTILTVAIILALLGAIIVISYGYHRMTNPTFSPRRSSTTTRSTAMAVPATSFWIIHGSVG
jgi:FlaG/FlaF family flagellin (archaellin)